MRSVISWHTAMTLLAIMQETYMNCTQNRNNNMKCAYSRNGAFMCMYMKKWCFSTVVS